DINNEDPFRAIAQNFQPNRRPDPGVGDGEGQVAIALESLAAILKDYVSRLESSLPSRAPRFDIDHKDAVRIIQMKALCELGCDLLNMHTQPAARNFARFDQLPVDFLHHVRGNCKADP